MDSILQQGRIPFPMRGKPTIQNRTEIFPTGDKVINEARKAFWEAWQIGLKQSGKSIYPKLPLLDRELMEPEI
jgi:hypothetical protein